eukprot:m.17295 g.17295  ORF g.17295 m.17295 type:complete len:82 (+) comp11119_c0_seq2:141-386(+)
MAASFFVQDSVVECLFAAGAKEDLQDKEGKTALDIAQEEHLDSIVAILQPSSCYLSLNSAHHLVGPSPCILPCHSAGTNAR